jgi:uncharacterized protein YkwD
MHRALKSRFRLLLAFLLGTGVVTLHPASRLMAFSAISPGGGSETPGQPQHATLKPAAAAEPEIPVRDAEFSIEQRLLELANQARQQAGVAPLMSDPGLCQAARIHAQAMFDAQQLSHQFTGEASLPLRLADATNLQLDQEGENVALDYDVEHGHEHLMLSPPHRANLLNPAYNVIGLGVVRSGDQLYIVQDFGHALPNYSLAEVKDQVAIAVNRTRHQTPQRVLPRQDLPGADDAACSMAQADKLATSAIHTLGEHFTVLAYTSLHPETLPPDATHAIASRNLRRLSIGACYARTETYPTGVYWIVLALD